ncbi:MAG: diguanylate cyclase [Gammaproteobacteria bacterium]|nr:diguanylate cyclase [Gammaproteobacteria bacterium]
MSNSLDSTLATLSLETAPIGVLIVHTKGDIIFFNKTFKTLFHINRPPESAHIDALPTTLRDAIKNQKEEITIHSKATDTKHFYKCWYNPSVDEKDHSIWFFLDVTKTTQVYQERDRLANELSKVSTRDPQTGLPNKSALMQGLEPLVSRSRRYNNPLSLIRLRINIKAEYIDQLENIMLLLSRFLRDQMRWADMVGRLTANEFLLVLPETGEQAANTLAHKITKKLSQLAVQKQDSIPSISIESGVSSWFKGDDMMRLIHNTEQNLIQNTKQS